MTERLPADRDPGGMSMENREQKARLLTKLREMLLRQRDKFQAYLVLLEREEQSLRQGDEERIAAQIEMENLIIAEIFALKKVVEPLRELYQAAYPQREDTIPPLEGTLARMQGEVAARNLRNRNILKEKLVLLRQEVSSVRRAPFVRSPYAAEVAPRLVDIRT
jgi:hypothetical protein